jgi:hypothetical protein
MESVPRNYRGQGQKNWKSTKEYEGVQKNTREYNGAQRSKSNIHVASLGMGHLHRYFVGPVFVNEKDCNFPEKIRRKGNSLFSNPSELRLKIQL